MAVSATSTEADVGGCRIVVRCFNPANLGHRAIWQVVVQPRPVFTTILGELHVTVVGADPD